MKLNSSKVFWLRFLVVGTVIIACGLFGNGLIVNSLKEQFVAHGLAHTRKVAVDLLPRLQQWLRSGMPREEVIARFQASLAWFLDADSYSVSLIDAKSGTILAHSDKRILLRNPVESHEWLEQSIARVKAEPAAHQWEIHDLRSGRSVMLTYMTWVVKERSDPDWLLSISADITELMNTMHGLHYRLSGTLVLTAGLLAIGGFLMLRKIGGAYEQYLENTVRARTQQLHAAQAEIVREARLATLGQTASMLAHEIRNPLASIKLSLSGLLSATYLQERENRRLQIALREVNRLDEMVADALNYVRPIKLSSEPIILDRLVDGVLRLVEPALLERKLHLNRSLCPECPKTRMDPNQMEQALLNLLKNAIEASPEGGQIDIAVSCKDRHLYFDIINEGNPIPPADLDKLFEPFYTTKPKGTGLGLMLVKRVIEEHGGEVCVMNRAQAGAHFSFKLPVITKAETPPMEVGS